MLTATLNQTGTATFNAASFTAPNPSDPPFVSPGYFEFYNFAKNGGAPLAIYEADASGFPVYDMNWYFTNGQQWRIFDYNISPDSGINPSTAALWKDGEFITSYAEFTAPAVFYYRSQNLTIAIDDTNTAEVPTDFIDSFDLSPFNPGPYTTSAGNLSQTLYQGNPANYLFLGDAGNVTMYLARNDAGTLRVYDVATYTAEFYPEVWIYGPPNYIVATDAGSNFLLIESTFAELPAAATFTIDTIEFDNPAYNALLSSFSFSILADDDYFYFIHAASNLILRVEKDWSTYDEFAMSYDAATQLVWDAFDSGSFPLSFGYSADANAIIMTGDFVSTSFFISQATFSLTPPAATGQNTLTLSDVIKLPCFDPCVPHAIRIV